MSRILHEYLTADANHTIHLVLPSEMSGEVEIVVFPRASSQTSAQQESLALAVLMDESGFSKKVLNSPQEDCWNDL